ncbi:UDP-N-acetylmuramate dehydrogenase [Flectobacillus major]|uniref:UDP-N-acetylmuramate dehydrogenase n=1 Tax=Flectobacillus major TaxID=103 RepID=UPI0004258EDE|nr:UDP-N-acetylmuramate dehydrogenase [Flectobacillus major]
MEIQENISLQPYNTFGLQATARYFVEVNTLEQLVTVLKDNTFQNLPRLFLGGGSNILLTKDFEGIVIKINLQGIEKQQENELHVWLKAGAGVVWHNFVLHCIAQNWAGVENLSLIPGTVGAAPMQNIGAYGVEIKDVFDELEALNLSTLQIEKFALDDCQFGYRESVFKHIYKNQYVILSVTFRLNKTPNFHIEYGAIKDTIAEMGVQQLSIKAISDAVIHIRQSKLPNPAEIGNSGSFFKNPEIPIAQFQALKERFPAMVSFPSITPALIKVPAGWLIEQAGWKGFKDGHIGVHAKQALVLVNYGGGKGNDIKALSEKIQASVFEKFGILLHPEVNFI